LQERQRFAPARERDDIRRIRQVLFFLDQSAVPVKKDCATQVQWVIIHNVPRSSARPERQHKFLAQVTRHFRFDAATPRINILRVSAFLIGLATLAMLGTPAVPASNPAASNPAVVIPPVNTNDPVDVDFRKVMTDDDNAEQEILRWMDSSDTFNKAGGQSSTMTLNLRIQQKLDGIKKEYEDFVDHHPDHVNARLAFGSFLNDNNDDVGALVQWEKARDLAPTNPAPWNNLGNYYAQPGRTVSKAFECYEKALALNSNQPVYYHNLAAAVYLFRPAAREFYKIDEKQVVEKSLKLYQDAIKLDPNNFVLATDYAECFYTTRPPRLQEGLEAWSAALKLAPDDAEREGVYIHMARINLQLQHFDLVKSNLDMVTNINYAELKADLSSNLAKALQKQPKN
jgi:hypothetical protein